MVQGSNQSLKRSSEQIDGARRGHMRSRSNISLAEVLSKSPQLNIEEASIDTSISNEAARPDNAHAQSKRNLLNPQVLTISRERPQIAASMADFLEGVSNRVMQSTNSLASSNNVSHGQASRPLSRASTSIYESRKTFGNDPEALVAKQMKDMVPLTGKSLGIFAPDNPFRVKLFKAVHHK